MVPSVGKTAAPRTLERRTRTESHEGHRVPRQRGIPAASGFEHASIEPQYVRLSGQVNRRSSDSRAIIEVLLTQLRLGHVRAGGNAVRKPDVPADARPAADRDPPQHG